MNKKFVYQVGNNKKVILWCTANEISRWIYVLNYGIIIIIIIIIIIVVVVVRITEPPLFTYLCGLGPYSWLYT